jgi:hypothetical protein
MVIQSAGFGGDGGDQSGSKGILAGKTSAIVVVRPGNSGRDNKDHRQSGCNVQRSSM